VVVRRSRRRRACPRSCCRCQLPRASSKCLLYLYLPSCATPRITLQYHAIGTINIRQIIVLNSTRHITLLATFNCHRQIAPPPKSCLGLSLAPRIGHSFTRTSVLPRYRYDGMRSSVTVKMQQSKAERHNVIGNLWAARILPFIVVGAVAYATYVLVALLSGMLILL
jgi:hypothetical protein